MAGAKEVARHAGSHPAESDEGEMHVASVAREGAAAPLESPRYCMNIVFSERFDDALAFTHQLHRRQVRKTSGVPYIAHPMSVAALVIEDGGSEDEAIAALLHDSLEDQGRHYPGGVAQLAQDIGARFGEEVLRIVQACTERTSEEEAA